MHRAGVRSISAIVSVTVCEAVNSPGMKEGTWQDMSDTPAVRYAGQNQTAG